MISILSTCAGVLTFFLLRKLSTISLRKSETPSPECPEGKAYDHRTLKYVDAPKKKPEWVTKGAKHYPDTSQFQFTKDEADAAFTRMIKSIGQVSDEEKLSENLKGFDELYVWGQKDPIRTIEYRYTNSGERDKYFVVWSFDNKVGIGRDTSYPSRENVNAWGALAKEQWETAFEAATLGIIEGVQDCFDTDTYHAYITTMYDQNKTLRNAITKTRGGAIINRQTIYRRTI